MNIVERRTTVEISGTRYPSICELFRIAFLIIYTLLILLTRGRLDIKGLIYFAVQLLIIIPALIVTLLFCQRTPLSGLRNNFSMSPVLLYLAICATGVLRTLLKSVVYSYSVCNKGTRSLTNLSADLVDIKIKCLLRLLLLPLLILFFRRW
jgi:hypothetical protein